MSLNKSYSETSCDLCFCCSWLRYVCTPGNRCTVFMIKNFSIYIVMSCVCHVGLDFQNSGRMFITLVCTSGGWLQRILAAWAYFDFCIPDLGNNVYNVSSVSLLFSHRALSLLLNLIALVSLSSELLFQEHMLKYSYENCWI